MILLQVVRNLIAVSFTCSSSSFDRVSVSLIIQKQYDFSDRELLEQITENPYYQYFIGLPGHQQEAPFVPPLLVEFRNTDASRCC